MKSDFIQGILYSGGKQKKKKNKNCFRISEAWLKIKDQSL